MFDRPDALGDFEVHLAYCHNLSLKEKADAIDAAANLMRRELRVPPSNPASFAWGSL